MNVKHVIKFLSGFDRRLTVKIRMADGTNKTVECISHFEGDSEIVLIAEEQIEEEKQHDNICRK